jgi:hypothetical protein
MGNETEIQDEAHDGQRHLYRTMGRHCRTRNRAHPFIEE